MNIDYYDSGLFKAIQRFVPEENRYCNIWKVILFLYNYPYAFIEG